MTGWRAATIPFLDRAPWTDPAKKSLVPKTEFQLPETIQTQSGAWTWTWTDREWRLASKTETDALGWTYGTLLWSLFDRHPKGWMSTRYRRWARTAALTNGVPTSPTAMMRNNNLVTSPTALRTPPPPPRIDTASPRNQQLSSMASPPSPNPSLMSRGKKLTSSVRFSTSSFTDQHDNDSVISHQSTTANNSNTNIASTTSLKKKLWSSGSSNNTSKSPSTTHAEPPSRRESVWRSIARVNNGTKHQ